MISDLNNKLIEFIDELINKHEDNDLILINDLGFYLSDLVELKRLKNNNNYDEAYDLEIEIAKTYRGCGFMNLVERYNMVNRYNDLLNDILKFKGL